jgi:hypothetical protein
MYGRPKDVGCYLASQMPLRYQATTKRVSVGLEKNYAYRIFQILYSVLKTEGTNPVS